MPRDRELVSRIMAHVRSRSTAPEREMAAALRRIGCPFRRQQRDLPGTPDFVFAGKRLVVFLDGDFWHGRQWKSRGHRSLANQFRRVNNREYWIEKISRNMRRDVRVRRLLNRAGWSVMRLWESEWKRSPDRCLSRIEARLKNKGKR